MRLQDKAIIVTGSTTGIGEAIARRCVAEGARVLIHGRDRARGEQVATEIGDRAVLHIDDLSDPLAPARIVAAAVKAWGRVDAVVNNAALIKRSNLHTTDAELFDAMMAVNARAPMLMVREAMEELGRNRGCVLNIGSINAYCGEQNLLGYSASKGALLTVSRNLADSLAPTGVRVTHFNVGWVLTPNEYQTKIDDGLSEDWPQQLPSTHAPSGRLIDPDEIAAAAVFWLSDESYPISGSVIELEQYPIIGRNPVKEEA